MGRLRTSLTVVGTRDDGDGARERRAKVKGEKGDQPLNSRPSKPSLQQSPPRRYGLSPPSLFPSSLSGDVKRVAIRSTGIRNPSSPPPQPLPD
jgi:hypothetical protein